MMPDTPVFATPPGASGNTIGAEGVQLDLLGLTVMAMAPGPVDLALHGVRPTLVVAPPHGKGGTVEVARIEGTAVDTLPATAGGFDLHAPVPSFELVCVNHGWECLIEMDEAKLPHLAAEAHGGRFGFDKPIDGGHDPALAQLAGLAIEHLRRGEPDRLYVEGLSVAMTARAFEVVRADAVRPVPTRGTDTRVARAIDYAEAHLGTNLSIADLASVAAMSPSWFQQCFRAATGRPVHAYVRERRLKRARILVLEGSLPLQQIAHACGFADASHMGRAFKARFGTTPGRAREG